MNAHLLKNIFYLASFPAKCQAEKTWERMKKIGAARS
jgi:hypothetical protein